MAAKAGRTLALLLLTAPATEAVRVAGVKEKSVEFSSDGIDITNDDDSGFQTFLADTAAVKTMSISVSGVAKDDVIKLWHLAGDHRPGTLEDTVSGAQTTGTFRCTSYSEKASQDGAVEFDATIVATGAFAYDATP
jgi:predicted secreted protein